MTDTAAPVPGPTQEAPARLDARSDALPGADLAGAPATVPALDWPPMTPSFCCPTAGPGALRTSCPSCATPPPAAACPILAS